MSSKIVLIHNPVAGVGVSPRVFEAVLQQLQPAGLAIDYRLTTRDEGTAALVRRVVDNGAETVLIAGGDGTISAAANALAYTGVALGVVPVGTANVWAHELGLTGRRYRVGHPAEMAAVIEAQLHGERRQIDLGQIGEHYFLMWAGIGLDAYAIDRLEPRSRFAKSFGMIHYTLSVLWYILQWRQQPIILRSGQEQVRGDFLLVIATNVRLYGGSLITLDGAANVTDGELSVWAIPGKNRFSAFYWLWQLMRGRHATHPDIKQLRDSYITVEAAQALPWHCDAEPMGRRRQFGIRVAPQALTILVPRARDIPILADK